MAKMHLTLQQTQLIYDLTGQRITSYNVDEATKNEIDKLNKSINTSNSSIEVSYAEELRH
ncbi:hypothetical protein B9T12_09630 [Wohlfahrtiimonas chitiniclastica]|uniref:hypothetical protein n=1 Tax=Wohlfahrtiimonas chitiniclastica TaxID=400946 RepID=UPI000B988891|nr:hypothetical protein [Wohlfahrtiimonas chitiniclastica]OYQ77082.1 hypothetical protein B9T12_09630 [Wohlfahrtiimonas chitiniclastica]